MFRRMRLVIISGAVAVFTAAGMAYAAPIALAQPAITQDSLINSPQVSSAGQNVTPTLTVHSSSCITVQALVVTARDSEGNNVGWGGNFSNPQICPSGYTLTPNPRSFPAGTYTEFGAYLLDNVRTNLPSQVLAVTSTPVQPGGPTEADQPTDQPSWDPSGSHTLTFDDEFNSNSVDTSKWATTWWVNPGNGNGISWSNNSYMIACYAASHDSEPGDGYLHMRLDNTASTCGTQRNYTGAVLDTHANFSQSGGEFEARVNLPCNSSGQVYGWPAWWTIDDTWTGEIDDVESGWPAASGGGTASHLEHTDFSGHFQNPGWQSSSPACGWHQFGAQWEPIIGHTVTFYWDGQAVFTHQFIDRGSQPQYLIFDYQMASQAIAPPTVGATMLVDWVRVWQ